MTDEPFSGVHWLPPGEIMAMGDAHHDDATAFQAAIDGVEIHYARTTCPCDPEITYDDTGVRRINHRRRAVP